MVSTFYWLSWQLTKPLSTSSTACLQNWTREDKSVYQWLLPSLEVSRNSRGSISNLIRGFWWIMASHSLRSSTCALSCKTISSGHSAYISNSWGVGWRKGTHTPWEKSLAAKQAPRKHVPTVLVIISRREQIYRITQLFRSGNTFKIIKSNH